MNQIILALAALAVVVGFLGIIACCSLASQSGSTWRPAREPDGASELTSYRLNAFVVQNGGHVTLLPCGRFQISAGRSSDPKSLLSFFERGADSTARNQFQAGNPASLIQ